MREVQMVRKRRNNPFLQGIMSKVRGRGRERDEGVGRDILKDTCGSVAQLRLFLCDPMDCSTTGFPVLHHFSEFTQTHVH